MAPIPEDLTGRRFGRLVIVSELPYRANRDRVRMLSARCDCGNMTEGRIDVFRRGDKRSCGCLKYEVGRAIMIAHRRTTHGESGRKTRTPEYTCWYGIVQRCEYKPNKSYPDYGGRGIKMCSRWRNGENGLSGYECFLSDMGRKPSTKHSIDRLDGNGNYEPSNCRWAPPEQQFSNRNVSRLRDEEGKLLSDIAKETGIRYMTLLQRYRRGDRGEQLRRPVIQDNRAKPL